MAQLTFLITLMFVVTASAAIEAPLGTQLSDVTMDDYVGVDGEIQSVVPNMTSLKAFYEANGYLHIPGFYNGHEVQELMAYTEEVQGVEESVGGQMMYYEEGRGGQGRILRRVEDFAHRHDGMLRMFMEPTSKMMRFGAELIGEELLLFKEKINFKLPGAAGFEEHQDHQAGWDKYVHWFVSIGVCVDPATTSNGCLEVAGGMHKQGLLGEEWKPLKDLELDYQPVECSPGDVIVFDSYVPHRSAPNETPNQRRMLFLTYNLASEGEHRVQYFADKRVSYPPDIERMPNRTYTYRV